MKKPMDFGLRAVTAAAWVKVWRVEMASVSGRAKSALPADSSILVPR